MSEVSPVFIAVVGGLVGGIVLGFAARWGRFCTFGAFEDKILGADGTRLRMWGLAIAIAIIGVFTLDSLDLINIVESAYLSTPVALSASIAGGLLFGLGMSLVGTCGFGIMARIGGGDLKSIVTFLVMGIAAFATMNGITAYLRIWLFPAPQTDQAPAGIAHILANTLGVNSNIIAFTLAVLLAGLMLMNGALLRRPRLLVSGALVGLTIVFGWWITGSAAADPFNPQAPGSFSFAAPLGDTILFIMASTGTEPNFGIGAVVGIIIGAFFTTKFLSDFRWEACDDAIELRRQMFGGVLMGIGGVLALGCSVGQGLSAASTLAISAPLVLIAMYAGSWLGLQFLVSGSWWTPIRNLLTQNVD